MQYLPVKWIFAPYLKEKLYYIIRNEEDTLVKFIKTLYPTMRFQRHDFDNHRRDAGARNYDIGNSGNNCTNGNGGGGGGGEDHSGAVERGQKGNKGTRGPAGGRLWANYVGVRRTWGYKSQDKNAAKP